MLPEPFQRRRVEARAGDFRPEQEHDSRNPDHAAERHPRLDLLPEDHEAET
jgi:hypothetical protein